MSADKKFKSISKKNEFETCHMEKSIKAIVTLRIIKHKVKVAVDRADLKIGTTENCLICSSIAVKS